jgi:hypothetical protein
MSAYADLIRETIRDRPLTDEQVELIEESVRHDIFHSTLDWQTKSQLKKGILQAYELLQKCGEIKRVTKK